MKARRYSFWLLCALLAAAALVVTLSPHTYSAQDREHLFAGASSNHLAGTDALGRDRAVRVSVAIILSLAGALAGAVVSTGVAAILGTGAAFAPRILRGLLMLGVDAFLALPWLFLLMIVRAALPLNTSPWRSMGITFATLAALGWPACTRTIHRKTLDLRSAEWMLQARASGLRSRQLVRYVLPNLLPVLVPQVLVSVPAFVMAEANLGAIGLGIGEPVPSWGSMLLELDNSPMLMRGAWVFLPIVLLVLILLLLEAMATEA